MILLYTKTTMTTGIIYKISSTDNKLNYYGLTTQPLQDRFKLHIQSYNRYKNNITTNYCTSYIIFNKYPLQQIQIQTVESYDNISLLDLRYREKYYIQNYDCVNYTGKKKPSDYTNFYDIHNKTYTHIQPSYTLHHFDNKLIQILQIIGYYITHNNDQTITITHTLVPNLQSIYNNFYKYLPHIQINKNNTIHNNIKILHYTFLPYNLILLHKIQNKRLYNNFFYDIQLLIIPNTPTTPTTPTTPNTHQQNLDILYNCYLNNISRKTKQNTTDTQNSTQQHTI